VPTNVTPHYQNAEKEYLQAKTLSDKIRCLQKMLSLSPSHKGGEKLRKDIKQRISKYKKLLEKEKQATKAGGRKGINVKKDGAAQVILLGKTNSGKSFLLSKLTNAKPLIADYEFTTKKPEIGTLDYNGVSIQIVELPAITENYIEKEKGPSFMSIVRGADLVVILAENNEEEKFIKKELENSGIVKKSIVVSKDDNLFEVKNNIWNSLNLIYVFTKSPGKEKDFPPVALKKKSTVRELAFNVHKDFVKKFDFAKVWGKSAKHQGMKCGLRHILDNGDVVELHLK